MPCSFSRRRRRSSRSRPLLSLSHSQALFEAPARVSPASPFAGPSSSRRGRAGSTAARGSERLRPGGLRNRGFTGGGRVWGKEGKDSEAERLGLGWAGGTGAGSGGGRSLYAIGLCPACDGRAALPCVHCESCGVQFRALAVGGAGG